MLGLKRTAATIREAATDAGRTVSTVGVIAVAALVVALVALVLAGRHGG